MSVTERASESERVNPVKPPVQQRPGRGTDGGREEHMQFSKWKKFKWKIVYCSLSPPFSLIIVMGRRSSPLAVPLVMIMIITMMMIMGPLCSQRQAGKTPLARSVPPDEYSS
jgi:hypothetical protein